MTLADAIRKGAMQRGQARWVLYDPINHTSCVLGAAFEGVSGMDAAAFDFNAAAMLWTMFPQLVEPIACPTCHSIQCPFRAGPPTLAEIIAHHLNDQHGWTREEIADWLDTLPPNLTKLFYDDRIARVGRMSGLLPDVGRAMKIRFRKLAVLLTRLGATSRLSGEAS